MSEQNSENHESAAAKMSNLIFPAMLTMPAIHAAAKLNIAELVDERPKTIDELAAATGTHAPSLRRLLNALKSMGIFLRDEEGRFSNTPMSNTLRADDPESIKPWALFLPSPFMLRACGELIHTVVTGEPAFEKVHGTNYFQYLAEHPDDAALFDAAMTSHSESDLPHVLEAYDFSGFKLIVDVGGGHGAFLSGVLAANPGVRGLLYDLPQVVAGATELLSGPAADRAEVRGGSFFESVPPGGDAYIVKNVLGDWNDDRALSILRNCRRAMKPENVLLIIGGLSTSSDEDSDLLMLVLVGGKSHSADDLRKLLGEAGFSVGRVISTSGSPSIIEAHPA